MMRRFLIERQMWVTILFFARKIYLYNSCNVNINITLIFNVLTIAIEVTYHKMFY